MLARDWNERPEPYKGIQMRSKLEVRCAQYLDRHGVVWFYERKINADDIGVRSVPYLPDFTIELRPNGLDDLELGRNYAHWIEVKPQEFLYTLRDRLDVPERCNQFVEVTGLELRDAGIEELWKPKRLAELAGADVLVVGHVDKDRTLSITMQPDGVHFRTDHPFVNHRGVRKRGERERQREQWAREAEERRLHWEAERQRQEAERWRDQIGRIRPALNAWVRGEAQYGGPCECCRSHYSAPDLSIYRSTGRYILVCHACEARASAA